MSYRNSLWQPKIEPALIVFRRSGNQSLWDADLSTLVEQLEDELGVFVTTAVDDGRTRALRDAAAAARFAGCTRAIVVVNEHDAAGVSTSEATPSSGVQITVAPTPTWRPDDVIRSFRSAQRPGACAA